MGGPRVPDDRRRLLLRAALGFLQLPPIEPELQLVHRWLDSWTGVGLITVGVERHGMRLSLSHIADDECVRRSSVQVPRLTGSDSVAIEIRVATGARPRTLA